MMKQRFRGIWAKSSPTARTTLAITMVVAVGALSALIPLTAATNFFGAALVAIGGMVAAWSKVEPEYFHAAQQGVAANATADDVREPKPDEVAFAKASLVAREKTGLALIAVGGVMIAGSALHSWVSPSPIPDHEHTASQAAFHIEH